jgi:histidinol dehydrogenase
MKIVRESWDGSDPPLFAEVVRGLGRDATTVDLVPAGAIIAEVENGGDEALLAIEARFGTAPRSLRVSAAQVLGASERIDAGVLEALRLAADNIRAVAEAQLGEPRSVSLPQGQTVEIEEVAVGAAGIYAPGGRAAYPSSVLMGCIPAKVAGVERVVLATPSNEEGEVPDVVLAAAAIAGADEVYAVGGAQAIAALALGTETIAPVDVIAGPGNVYVQEAKRQLLGRVGIDGIAGPSELMVIAGETTDPDRVALDLCAQAEHGDDGLLVAAAVESSFLDRLEERLEALSAERPSVTDAPVALIDVPDTDAGAALAEAIAPEHLELAVEDAELLARSIRTAGCIFTGERGATAFGDYVAGSNHVLPTGGAGRFQGPLSPSKFRRRVSVVEIPAEAARALAPAGATLARAEGFPVHAESMEARADDQNS